jgi:TPR repeat protein
MRARGFVRSSILASVVSCVVVGVATLAAGVPVAGAAPVCKERDDCKRACGDGGGPTLECTRYADLLAAGKGGEPERAEALALYRRACGARDGDPAACLAGARLAGEGRMLEVDRDPALQRSLLQLGVGLAAPRCAAGDGGACGLTAELIQSEVAAGVADAAQLTDAVARAERGCTLRDFPSCLMIDRQALAWQEKDVIDAAAGARLKTLAESGIVAACTVAHLGEACELAAQRELKGGRGAELLAASRKSCAEGDDVGCIAEVRLTIDELEHTDDVAALKKMVDLAIKACETADDPACHEIHDLKLNGMEDVSLAPDPRGGRAYVERRCQRGDVGACELAGLLYLGAAQYPDLDADPAKARFYGTRVCMLSSPTDECPLCNLDPDAPVCQLRATWAAHQRCAAGSLDACEDSGRRFRDGAGVDADGTRAARYYRRSCAGARKTACAALDELCLADGTVDRELCVQSLIHTDLFYEAEWQFRATGSAQLMGKPEGGAGAAVAVAVASAPGAGGAGVSLSRGHLDADLVVSVVLDRARQAAIRLVVDELTRARKGARAQYLKDLLSQGARLLADPSTLRREKFADLAMTVVRAFIAANLIDTIYPDADAVFDAPVIGAQVKAAGTALGQRPGGPIAPALRTFLVDLAYVRLGDTHLFARAGDGDAADEPAAAPCPWPNGPGVEVCAALAPADKALAALKLDRVLEGVRLAKALRAAGTIDLRRLIDAVARSRSIADLGGTPGLVLAQWRSELIDGTRAKIQLVRSQLADLKVLTRMSVYAEGGADLATLATRLAGARAFMDGPAARLALRSEDRQRFTTLFDVIDAGANAGLAGGTVLAEVRAKASAALKAWGARDLVELLDRLAQLEKTASAVTPALEKLERSIYAIETIMARFGHDGVRSLDLAEVPLYAMGELRDAYVDAVGALSALDVQLRQLFPGTDGAQLEFARSAAIRLLGLLDLLERVARTSRLQETVGDVVSALRLLGSHRHGEFTAPLFDVVDPVLDAIKTHEPMSVELLFAVISRVRLDSLIESLQGGGRACARDASVDCWTVKIIHALQESVERDGDLIRVDGGKFAQRLAAHGDDFRRRHKWRGIFHLTVGVGAMASTPPGEAERRNVPVIAEQVGFAWASPSVWNDRLTFKVGAAASGVLYRALLDSNESNAIMLHPALFAVDVYDIVELYVSPATLLVYPPDEDRGTQLRWGVSAGLSVPLSAYLERL